MSSAFNSDIGDRDPNKNALSPVAFVALMDASNKVDVSFLYPSRQSNLKHLLGT